MGTEKVRLDPEQEILVRLGLLQPKQSDQHGARAMVSFMDLCATTSIGNLMVSNTLKTLVADGLVVWDHANLGLTESGWGRYRELTGDVGEVPAELQVLTATVPTVDYVAGLEARVEKLEAYVVALVDLCRRMASAADSIRETTEWSGCGPVEDALRRWEREANKDGMVTE